MSKVKNFFKKSGETSLEYASRLGNQTHLSMLRDTFAIITPLIIAGALAVLIRTFVFAGAGSDPKVSILGWIAKAKGDINTSGSSWAFTSEGFINASKIGNFLFFAVNHATIDMMSIYVAFGIGYFLSGIRCSDNKVIGGLVSLGSFMTAILGKTGLMDAQGLVTAILIGILSTEAYVILSKSEKLRINMPAGVPPAVSRSFAKLFPSMIVLSSVLLFNLPFVLLGMYTHTVPAQNLWGESVTFVIGDAIFYGIQSPFMSVLSSDGAGLGIAILYTFAVSILWFFGLHGSNILMGIFSPIFWALYGENVNGASHIFVQGTYDAFIMIGGTGATFGLILAVFIFTRKKDAAAYEISKLGVGPAIFQINEPVLFGMPLVLNVKYFIPFVFAMPILTLTTWAGFNMFKIHPVTVVIPWTAPVGIGGLLATAMDWKGFLLAFINFAIAFGIWTPFAIIAASKSSKYKLVKEKNDSKMKAGINNG